MMQAVVFNEPQAKTVQNRCLEAGLVVNAVDDHVLRLVPPLIMTADDVEKAVEILKTAASS